MSATGGFQLPPTRRVEVFPAPAGGTYMVCAIGGDGVADEEDAADATRGGKTNCDGAMVEEAKAARFRLKKSILTVD